MYKDRDKQREANRKAKDRFKAKGIPEQGIPKGIPAEGIPAGIPDDEILHELQCKRPHPVGSSQEYIARANTGVQAFLSRHEIGWLKARGVFIPCWRMERTN